MDTTAKSRYEALKTYRDPYLRRARKCAEVTIPTLLPPEGSDGSTDLPTPWQALGARCVNTLSAKLLLTLFPPSSSFFKLSIDDAALAKLGIKREDAEEKLSSVERAVTREIETTATRPPLFEALKHLIVAGNVLTYIPLTSAPPRVFRLDQYVCKRSPNGELLEIVTHEKVSPLELTDEQRTRIDAAGMTPSGGLPSAEKSLDLFTRVWRTESNWKLSQEVQGVVLTTAEFPLDACPYRAHRLIVVHNEDFGRSLVEEYLGDFLTLEGLQRAVTEGAAAAAKLLILVDPTGVTKLSDVANAPSGAVRKGKKDNVTTVQAEKYADFRAALELRNTIAESLSQAFLLFAGVQRQAERVTAEEIRLMAQELESGLGGIYSNLSQELQLPLVVLLLRRLENLGKIPKLPKEYVSPAITTGLDAVGRGADRGRLTNFVGTLVQIDPRVLEVLNLRVLASRLAVADGIDIKDLIKSEEVIAQEQQQQQMQELASRAAPNIANQVGNAMQGGQP